MLYLQTAVGNCLAYQLFEKLKNKITTFKDNGNGGGNENDNDDEINDIKSSKCRKKQAVEHFFIIHKTK